MTIKQTIKTLVLSTVTLGALGATLVAAPVDAQQKCGSVNTAIVSCNPTPDGNQDLKQTGVWQVLLLVINIMTAGIGILAVGAIAYGGVLYASAGGSAEQTKKAITIITNTVIGLICFLLMTAILNFLIPGGVFNA